MAGLSLAACLGAAPAWADMTNYSLFFSQENQQTGPSTVVPFNGGTNYFFSVNSNTQSAGDF